MTQEEFIKQHEHTNYCEALIAPNGDISYSEPSHVYALMNIADEPKEELDDMIPTRAAPLEWLIEHTGYTAVWFNHIILPEQYTDEQMQSLQALCDAGIIKDGISGHTTAEKTNCGIFAKLEESSYESLFDHMHKHKTIQIKKNI